MATLNITNIPAPRVPFIDERTGLMAREWYRFFLNLFVLTGSGTNPTTLEELQIGPPSQQDFTEIIAQVTNNLGPEYQDQSGDFLATLDTAQLMSMMARFENAEAAIQGAYLQPPQLPVDGVYVVGPSSSTDNAVARFDGTTGKLIQNSVTTIDDTGNASGILSQQFSDGTAVTLAAGKFWYDGTTGSWNAGMGGGNITQQVGEELFIYGKASAAITEGQLICKTGTVGASGVITFAPSPTGLTTNDGIIGVATENIALNGFGRITSFGVVHGVTTTGASVGETWSDNDTLYYNPAYTGGLTNVKPSAPYAKFEIATVIKAGSGGSGSLQVELVHGSTLGGTDSNVQFSALANGNIIQYDSTLGYWKNVPLSTAGAVTSVTGTSPVVSSGGTTPAISLASGYGDTLNPYAVKTANYVLAGPTTGASAVPAFRALVAADIPALPYGTGTVTSVAALTLGTTGTDLSSTVANGTTTPVITLNVPTASATNRGALSAADWTTFNNKQPAGTYVTSVTGTAPVVSSGGTTPAISMAAATTSVNGYLTSTDWTTFNSKQAALVSGTNIKTVNGTTLLGSGDLGTITYAYGGTGQTTVTTGDLLYGSASNVWSKLGIGTTGQILRVVSGAPAWGTDYTGTVTSVAQSFTGGLISVAGSPITTSGTLALTVAGTSGGIPYFSSGTTWASSAALTANALMVGGGAGAAPSTVTTGTGVVTALGVNTGTAGAFVVNGGALGTPSSGTVTNLTGTASINTNGAHNGTVGATTPNTGAFTTVNASSTGAFGGTLVTGATASVTAVGNATFYIQSTGATADYRDWLFAAFTNNHFYGRHINDAHNLDSYWVDVLAGASGTIASTTLNASTGGHVYQAINSATVTDVSSTGLAVTGTAIASTSVGVGNTTPSGGGAGIAFPATQSASTNANTLDDYEEGTWTPNQGSGLVLVGAFSSVGNYVKIGRVVTVQGYLAGATSVSVAGGFNILTSNLPFSCNTNQTPAYAGNGASSAFAGTYVNALTIGSIETIAATSNIYFFATYYTST